MFALLILLAFVPQDPPAKALPAVAEPDWSVIAAQKPEDLRTAKEHWQTSFKIRDIHKIKDPAEKKAASERNDVAFAFLHKHPDLAYAAGLDLLRTTKSDWERLTIGIVVHEMMPEKGRAGARWAFAQATSPDEAFKFVFPVLCKWAEGRDPADLPALWLMLRSEAGTYYLAGHVWTLSPQRCQQYVFSRLGPDVVPYLRGALADANPVVRRNAACLLGFFLDDASRPALLRLLRAGGPAAEGAALALGDLGGADTVRLLMETLKSSDARLRSSATYALYEPGAAEAISAVEAAMNVETVERVREEMKFTLEQLQQQAKPPEQPVKRLSAEALRRELALAKEKRGMEGDAEAVAAAATLADLPELVEIRRLTLRHFSDEADHQFVAWSKAIRAVRQRGK